MRNDAASVLLAVSRRARHVLKALNPQCFRYCSDGIMMSCTHECDALSEAVLIGVS